MSFLYRGVSEELYLKLNGKLKPKISNQQFASHAHFGESPAVFGSGIVFGESNINSVVRHQWAQAGIPTSGVSTTPSIERARIYALNECKLKKGYIFKLSVERLYQAGVSIYKVNELVPYPAIPEDDEHILVADDFGSIPESAIISVEVVI